MKVKLSVVIITYNEELNIGRCLDSVQKVANDIVVVDSFSADRTKEICLSKGARFVEHAFEGHIEQKNWAISQALHPHILSLDADEALSEKLEKQILQAKDNWQHDGYFFNRLTNYCGHWVKHCGWYPDKKLRLWDSRLGSWTGENPHDKFELNKGASQQYLRGDLLHYSYHSISQHIQQVDKFTEIASIAAHRNGSRSNLAKILFKPLWKFVKDYFIKLGILDGYYGFVISVVSSHANFIKYVKIRQIQKAQHELGQTKTNSST